MHDPMIQFVARVAGVLVAAGLVSLLLHRASASLRALVWTVALAGVVVLPIAGRFAPRLDVAVLPAPALPAALPAALSAAAPAALALPPGAVDAWREEAAMAPAPRTVEPAPDDVRATGQSAMTRDDRGAPLDLRYLLLLGWALVSFAFVVRLLVSHVRLSRLVARAGGASGAWTSLVDATRAELGIRRSVAVRRSPEVDVPIVAGVVTPVLILPLDDSWTSAERRDVALHELAHVARWDALAQAMSGVACAFYWFLPLTWWAAREAAALREQACDNVVLRAGTRPSAYAERLLAFARAPRVALIEPVALAMARPTRLHSRLLSLLDPRVGRSHLSARSTLAVIALAGIVVTLAAAVRPVAAEAATAEPTSTPSVQAATSTAVQQPRKRSAICREGVTNNSIHRNSDDGEDTWRLSAKGPRCEVSVRIEGEPRFNDAFTDVTDISGRGILEVDATIDGVRRELRLRDEGSRIERSWRVDGRERPYDAEAAAWFADFLIGLDRQTAFAVDVRLPLLLRQGGVAAVLAETAEMPSDYARSAYHTALSKSRRLSADELARLLELEARLSTSDYYAAELLKGVARQELGDPVVRDGVMRLIGRMKSDFYRAESIKATMVAGRVQNDEIELLVPVIGSMKSDFYKAESVKLLLASEQLSAAQAADLLAIVGGMKSDFHVAELLGVLARRRVLGPEARRAYLGAVRGMSSDHYEAEALKGFIDAGAPGAEERASFFVAAQGIESDHYHGEVLNRLLQVRQLGEADLLAAERSSRDIKSDHGRAEVLRRIGGHAAATAAVRDAVDAAAESLGRHYRDEVRRSLGR